MIQSLLKDESEKLSVILNKNTENLKLNDCNKIGNSDAEGYCKKEVNRRIETDKINDIMKSGDVSRCEELKDDAAKKICKSVMERK